MVQRLNFGGVHVLNGSQCNWGDNAYRNAYESKHYKPNLPYHFLVISEEWMLSVTLCIAVWGLTCKK